jgi:pimeloyl-ACP methyl ester carboxylesterase
MRRQLLTVAAIAGMVTALLPATNGYASGSTGAGAGTRPSTLTWGVCPPSTVGVERDPRQQCATLSVPLDYRDPDGRRITVEVSRIPAAKPSLRRGILLLNPGGPGGPGLDLPTLLLPSMPASVTDRFDLIGFDPRGVAYSTPVTCGLPADVPVDLVLPYPSPDGSTTRNVEFARRAARDCNRLSGDLLPYITTANTARDMDQIRAALGEEELSYLGYSYGTYLGAVYTTLFPGNSDRILLDSAVNPDLVWYQFWRTWGPGVAIRLSDFTAWAADHDAVYHLGATQAAVKRTYFDLASRFDRDPLTLPSGSVITGNTFREITRSGLYITARFPLLAESWQYLADPTTAPSSAPAALASALQELAPSTSAAPQVPADNGYAALFAVVCDDTAWPHDIGTYARNVAIGRHVFPATAGMPDNIWPCTFWPTHPIEPPVKVTPQGPRNVLILQNMHDPASSWISGFGMRKALGARAAFVSVNQGDHGVYLVTDVPCATDIATTFLTTGALPRHDSVCPGQSPPKVSSSASQRRPKLPSPFG